MTAALTVLSSIVIAAGSPQASPAPSASPSAFPPPPYTVVSGPAPLRHLTYTISYSERRESKVQEFGDRSQGDPGPPLGVASTPAAVPLGRSDTGSLDVDVLRIALNGIEVRVVEHWNSRKGGTPFTGVVTSDGVIAFGEQIQDMGRPTKYALEFLAFGLAHDRAGARGERWVLDASLDDGRQTTTLTVKDRQGDVSLLDELQVIRVKHVQGVDVTTHGSVRYKEAKLVALSGTLQERYTVTTPDRVDSTTADIRFERQTDTLDP